MEEGVEDNDRTKPLQPFIEILRNNPHDAIALLKSKRAEGCIPEWIYAVCDRIRNFFKRI